MTDKAGQDLINSINKLIKVIGVSHNSSATSMASNSDEYSSDKVRTDNARNKILSKMLESDKETLKVQKEIERTKNDILKLESKNKKLDDERTKILKKEKEFIQFKKDSSKRMSVEDKKINDKLLADAKVSYDNEKKKYKLLEQEFDLEKQLSDVQSKASVDSQKAIDKQMAKDEKRAKLGNRLNNIGNSIQEKAVEKLDSLNEGLFSWAKKIFTKTLDQDSAMSKLSANYALSSKESSVLKANMMDAAITTQKIGVGVEDLVKAQAGYTDEIGRSVMLTENGLIAVSKLGIATGIGADGAARMAGEMENFGFSAESSVGLIEKLMQTSKKNGMSTSVMTKKFEDNLKIANSYTFKNGLRGVADMTAYSEKFKINMSSIAAFADQVSSPEGAIKTAANLQVLGGSFAQMADPLKLMNEGINDLEGLTKTYAKMLDGVAQVNKKTGEVTIGGYDRLRLQAAAKATGISYDDMMESTRAKAKRTAIESDFKLNPSIGTADEDTKNIIASLAQFKQGKGFEINVSGKNKLVTQLDPKDISALQPKDDSLNLKTVAENTMGMRDVISNQLQSIEQSIIKSIYPVIKDIFNILEPILGKISNFVRGASGNQIEGSAKGINGIAKGASSALMGIGKLVSSIGGKVAGKFGLEEAGKLGGKFMSKRMYGLGSAVSAGFALNDYNKGDYLGAGLQTASGIANLVPGAGTAVSAGIDLLDAYREYNGFGVPQKANDMILPSGGGNPIMLNTKDDVYAMKPGGALAQAVEPSIGVKKTYGGVTPSFSNVYSSGGSGSGKYDLNINGTINLVAGNSSTKISATELIKDRNFLRELARVIQTQMNRDKNGGAFAGGLNNNSF
jgi:hypothetical protein